MAEDPTTPLLADDAEEVATRTRYADWARHALDVVTALPAETVPPWWGLPTAAGSLTWSTPTSVDQPQAAAVDLARASGWLVAPGEPPHGRETGPLAGLAVAVKDVVDVAGLPTRNGTSGGLWRDPVRSATAWQQLADAGAWSVGKAATHEMAWGVTTPQVPHPRSPAHSCGGSSGGAAASVAAGAAHGGLGTDTGGSVRIPAALCGVVGFRPTTTAVDLTGVTPLAPEQDTVGTLAVDLPTSLAMLETLLARPLTAPTDTRPPARVGVLYRPGRLTPAVRRGYEGALAALADAGVALVPCDGAVVSLAANVSLLTMLRSSALLHAATVCAAPTAFGGQARALLTLGTSLREHGAVIARGRESVTAGTARLFDDARLDAFLTPTTACTAPLRDAESADVDGRSEPVAAALTRFTAWAAVAALPAVNVPLPTPPDAWPVGIQVMAPPHHEHVCARLARILTDKETDP